MVTAELQLATLRQWLTTCQTENIHTALHIETLTRSLVSCTVTMVDIRMKMISCLTWMGMREMPSGFTVTNHLSVYAAHSQVLQCCKVLFSSATHIAASNLKETIPNYYESKLLSKLIKRTIMFVVCIGYWSNCNHSYCSSNFCGGHEGDCSIDIGVCCAGDGRAGPGHHSHQVSRPETLKYSDSGDTNGELPASDTTDVDPGSEILFRNNWKHQVKMGNGVLW